MSNRQKMIEEIIDLSLRTSTVGINPADGARYTMTSSVQEKFNLYCQLVGGREKVRDEVIAFQELDPRADPDCGNWMWTMLINMVSEEYNK